MGVIEDSDQILETSRAPLNMSAWVFTRDITVNPVLSGHLKIDKNLILMTNGSLMNRKYCRVLPLEHSAILLTCIKQ